MAPPAPPGCGRRLPPPTRPGRRPLLTGRRPRPCGPCEAAGPPCSRPSCQARPFPAPRQTLLLDGLLHGVGQGLPPRRGRAPDAHPEDRVAAGLERLEIAQRLRLLQGGERIGLARHLHVLAVLLDDLEEDARRRAALVQLARRVQVARTVSGGR